MHLQWIDYLIILIYFGFVIGIGVVLKNFAKTSTDFFLSGRSIPASLDAEARPSATLHSRHGCPEAEAVARSYEQAPRAAQDHRAVGERLPAVPPAAPAAPRVPALRQLRRA